MKRLIAVTAAAVLALTACGGEREPEAGGTKRLSIATGNTTGVYYVLGGGIAAQINKNMPGYQATAEATGASVENIQRVVKGDSDLAFTLADSAGDAVNGKGAFSAPQPIRAIARLYDNYTHVIALADAKVRSIADLRGKRVSTGSANSGTEVIALRMLKAAGLDPDKDVKRQSLGLPETVQGMKDGTIDALVWSGGLPTSGITDLMTGLGNKATFVPLDDVQPKLAQEYGPVYNPGTIPAASYKLPADVPTIVVPNLLIVNEKMDEGLAQNLTKLLFERKADLEKVHPAARNIKPDVAAKTEPVQLHPGARKHYGAP
ncbi:TAXI family TRAP transporter solute-binding subunit [Bailinhaonella thermotolerans]|uniref:TAXI family TRAP transporter solute-binding subunit n=1 Tax=Bailinhaonella thermotolerans TaxID=1070861 RepID=A0A3A4AEA3_9ACTN|nr:TAXI family TRAP transporter solute-binding subunit [Bailinhaonella thermotolerans]RJL26639.1 TAXI family TRAP transporter solute-binding subunit [Bailinhaonella thermotolerans]